LFSPQPSLDEVSILRHVGSLGLGTNISVKRREQD
jgi:hypothetical protein